MFHGFKRERMVRKALHAIARQRVVVILQPGDVPVIELSPPESDWFNVAVRTCHIRGWVEVLHESLPSGQVSFEAGAAVFPKELKAKPHYRLTEGGWAVIHRSHAWIVATFIVGALSLIASTVAVVITWSPGSTQSGNPTNESNQDN